MDWSEEGVVLGVRRQGENNVVLELLTREHGRHLGLVRGGRGRRLRPVLQTGNIVEATWRGRLAEHLGTFTVEALEMNAARIMDDPARLSGLMTMATHARLLPEREPHPRLCDAFRIVLGLMCTGEIWPALLVRSELGLLEELGFGLDLEKCAATGTSSELVYVSPKSGKAVSAMAGEPYRKKLFSLPAFVTGQSSGEPSEQEVSDGFRMTGYFLEKHLYGPRGIDLPDSRAALLSRLSASG